jgi:hypothetical protein
MELTRTESTQVVRPLHVLVPLIKQDLQNAKEAADEAALPYWQAAGDKMLEAKEHYKGRINEFEAWLKRNFDIGLTQARRYMKVAGETINRGRGRGNSETLSGAIRASGGSPRGSPRGGGAWHEPIKEVIGRVNVEALKQDALAKQEERALQRKLALNLIDIGYKALASKLHPDKGGSREAMARLNRVRDILRDAVSA